jgi:hypothetical protein
VETTIESQHQINSFGWLKEIAIGLILLCIILIPFIYKLESNRFHGDENHFFRYTKYFKLFFIDKDLNHELWKDPLAYDHPPVGKYVLGLSLFVFGYGDRIEELWNMNPWNFHKDYNWNVSQGALPPKDILYVGRLTMAILGGLTCFLIYWVGRTIFSIRVGIIAALLLAYNPLMLSCSKRAMFDAPLLFFMTINLMLIMFFYRSFLKGKHLRTFSFAALIGIDIALAAGTKPNGGLAGIIFAMFCLLFALIKIGRYRFSEGKRKGMIAKLTADKEVKIILSSLMISGCIAILVFVGINPTLYHRPLKGSMKMVKYRMSVVNAQQKNFGHAITSLSQKFNLVIKRTLIEKSYVTLGKIFKFPIDFGLFLLGLIILLYTEVKYLLKNNKPSLKSIMIVWIFITFAGIMAWIPLDWNRYYLPVVPCVVMMTGYGIDRMINKCWLIIKRHNPYPNQGSPVV